MKTTILICAALLATPATAEDMKMPDLMKQTGATAITDEHIAALNACDWTRLMAQYPDDVLIVTPGGTWFEGRQAVGALFEGFCKDRADGGFKGATFTAEKTFAVGDTVTMSWIVTADWLAEPYKGADAYVTKDGLMNAQVTTFDPADMKLK